MSNKLNKAMVYISGRGDKDHLIYFNDHYYALEWLVETHQDIKTWFLVLIVCQSYQLVFHVNLSFQGQKIKEHSRIGNITNTVFQSFIKDGIERK